MDTAPVSVRVRDVWLWPDGGRVARPWIAESAGGDALAKAGAVVATQLKILLGSHEARLRSARVQVMVADEPWPDDHVELTVFDDLMEGGEAGRVVVPATVAQLSLEQRWWLAFTVLRRACEELALVADEDVGPWSQMAVELLARGPVERLASAWKAAPDRRHRARLVTELRVDRPSETWIEVARRGQEEPMGRSKMVHAAPSRGRLEAPVWLDSTTAAVGLLVDRGGRLLRSAELVAGLDDLQAVAPLAVMALGTEPQVPTVRVTHFSTRDPARPADVVIGAINGQPSLLPREHRLAWRAVGQARLPELKEWWSTSGLATLDVSAVCLAEASRPSSWLDGRDLSVEVPLNPRATAEVEPEQAALDALQVAVGVAARRAKIAPLTLT